MHIGFDAKRAFFNVTGLGNYSRSLLLALFQHFPQHDYHLFSPKTPKQLFQEGCTFPNVQLHTSSSSLFSAYWRTFQIGKQLEQHKIDIYHGLSHELPFDIQKAKHTRKIVTIHDLIFLRYPQDFPWIDRQMYSQKFRFACKNADTIVAISSQSKADIVHYFGTNPDKIAVIPPVMREDFTLSSGIPTDFPSEILHTPYILYVGAQSSRKNVISLLKALPFLPTSLKIVLVGRGHEQKNLQQYLAQHHLQARVLFLTNVSDEMLPFLYQQAKCVVYPSVFEGFGLPIVEALQCGVPVITGENACFVEAGGEGILYVNQTNPEEIAGAVLQLLENEALAKKLVEKGQAHIQQFRAENVTKRLMEIYLE